VASLATSPSPCNAYLSLLAAGTTTTATTAAATGRDVVVVVLHVVACVYGDSKVTNALGWKQEASPPNGHGWTCRKWP